MSWKLSWGTAGALTNPSLRGILRAQSTELMVALGPLEAWLSSCSAETKTEIVWGVYHWPPCDLVCGLRGTTSMKREKALKTPASALLTVLWAHSPACCPRDHPLWSL